MFLINRPANGGNGDANVQDVRGLLGRLAVVPGTLRVIAVRYSRAASRRECATQAGRGQTGARCSCGGGRPSYIASLRRGQLSMLHGTAGRTGDPTGGGGCINFAVVSPKQILALRGVGEGLELQMHAASA